MDKEQRLPTRLPFPADNAGRAFERDFAHFIHHELDRRMERLISPENHYSLHHGHGWTFQRMDDVSAEGEIMGHRAEALLTTQSIAENDLTALPRFVGNLVSMLVDQAERSLFESAAEAAEGVGNVVSKKVGSSVADTVLAMLRKMDFGVDREGNVTEPTIVLSPEDTNRLSEEAAADGGRFRREYDAIVAEKGSEARVREAERVARYKTRIDADE